MDGKLSTCNLSPTIFIDIGLETERVDRIPFYLTDKASTREALCAVYLDDFDLDIVVRVLDKSYLGMPMVCLAQSKR